MDPANLQSQEQMLRGMFQKHGTNANWAEVRVYITYRELVGQFGPPCEDYDPLCFCCRAHLEWQTEGKVTFKITRDDALEIINR